MATLHSNISPSSAERWIACPGSVALCATLPRSKSSEAAAEGTCAHSLGEMLLTNKKTKRDIIAMEGETVPVDDYEITIDEEMIDGAIFYYDTVMAARAAVVAMGRPGEVQVRVEQRVVAKSVDEHLYGTSDVCVFQKGNRLVVPDFKYGKGVMVGCEGNKQLEIYAIGVMDSVAGWAFDSVDIGIIQPRNRDEDRRVAWATYTTARLKEIAAELKVAVARTREKDAEFCAGDHCRWCPAKVDCPVMFAGIQKAAEVDFTAVSVPAAVGSLPDPRLLTVDKMAYALEWEDAINSWFEAIRQRAVEILGDGGEFPGWKLVDKKSNRQWVDEAAVVVEFGAVLGEDEMYAPKKLLSPAKLEKIVGKGKLDAFTVKPDIGKALARFSDKRPAARSSAADDFGGQPPAMKTETKTETKLVGIEKDPDLKGLA